MDNRRRSDSGANQPAVQVVGFHVEGQSPSPGPSSLLADSMRKITAGSPTPVIIPPHFQASRPETTASRNLGSDFAGGKQQGQPGIAIPQRRSLDRPAAVQEEGEATTGPSTAPAASSTAAAAAAAAAAKKAARDAPTSPSKAAAAAAAGAGPSGAAPAAAAAAASGGASSSAAAAQEGAPTTSRRGKPDNRPENIVPRPKPATKAERRAKQEASRAAKAAAKAAAEGGGGRPTSAGAASDGGASTTSRSSRTGGGGAAEGGSSSRGGAAGGSRGGAGSEAGDVSRPPSGASGGGAAGGGEEGSSRAAPRGSTERRSRTSGGMLHFTELFAHLPQYKGVSVEGMLAQQQQRDAANVHPAVFALGLQYADGSIKGSTARCVAMVNALAQMVADYTTPDGKSLARDLMSCLNGAVDYLVRCRPLSVSMGNAIKTIKLGISKIDPAEPEGSAKASILRLMGDYIHEKVTVADQVLVPLAVAKVSDGDVILTYAYSQVVLRVLLEAAAAGRRFRVVVVDGRPELEGRQMLRRLLQAEVPCSYIYLSGLSYILGEVTKVVLGAAAVLSNGTVVSRAGCAAVAMMASANSVPVLVCCETFKFHERVQLDSITHNELGDPEALVQVPPHVRQAAAGGGSAAAGGGLRGASLSGWQSQPRLGLLNLKYDAMPAEYVTVVVTEFGMIPPSSVPVILREYSESAQEQ